MNELQTENEKPLLVVKYVWWRVLYAQLSFLIGIIFGLGLSLYIDGCSIGSYFSIILFGGIGLFAIYSFLELLFFKELKLYQHRIEKVYYLVGTKQIDFQNKILKRIGIALPSMTFFIFIPNKKYNFLFGRLNIPLHLLSQIDRKKLIEIFASISGHTAQQIEEVGLYGQSLNPFIAEYKN